MAKFETKLTDREVVEKARKYVFELCSGKRRWVMPVPANPDEDVDLILDRALTIAESSLPDDSTTNGRG